VIDTPGSSATYVPSELPQRRAVTNGSVKLLLVDDHALLRQSLRTLLEREGLEVIGEAGGGAEAVELAERLHPDVAVVDFAMPDQNGIEATRQIAQVSPATRVIILSMYDGASYIRAARAAGAVGYVIKGQPVSELLRAIREVGRGNTYFRTPGAGRDRAPGAEPGADPLETLSRRQLEVLERVAQGETTVQVAAALGISPKTVEAHRTAVMRKLGVHRTAELVRYAVRLGLVHA
jgi:DNA-binding NarL/FixJ family response regulator